MKEQALKERLKRASADLGIAFNDVWHQLLLERFLVRLSHSPFADRFILKGGQLLAHYIKIDRETKDLDFLVTKIQAEKANIQTALEDILSRDLQDDFIFTLATIGDLPHAHMKYPGFTAKINALIGKMRGVLSIDIGVGDLVDPVEDSIGLLRASDKPIFEDAISLLVYPPETIFAEKIQTAAARGALNSRMKDYHDLVSLISYDRLINKKDLGSQIERTFSHRGTDIKLLPLQFSENDLEQLQKYWSSYLVRQKMRTKALPESIETVIKTINDWLGGIPKSAS